MKVKSKSHSVVADSLWTHGILQARILEWVARGSSQPRNGTQVSRIAGRFFTSWALREAHQCNASCQIRNPKNYKEYSLKNL